MSCGCTYAGVGFQGPCGRGCGGFNGCLYNVNVPPTTDTDLIFSNINLTGIGVLNDVTGPNINFRGVASASPQLTVSLDSGNHTILLTLDVAAITAAIPQATTTVKGIGETATDAEALAKASVLTFVTPSNFAAMASTATFAGLVELATNAEALTGTSTTLALTPANLTFVIANSTLGTQVFADAVARNAAVPNFAGQSGWQTDTSQPFVAFGTAAGEWEPVLVGANNNTFGIATTTTFTLSGGSIFSFDGDGSGIYEFKTNLFRFSNSCVLDIQASCSVSLGGANVPVSNLLISNTVVPGQMESIGVNQFLSTRNTSTGWTNFTNSLVRKTGDCNTITLPQLAQVVDTLIQTLGTARLLPIP